MKEYKNLKIIEFPLGDGGKSLTDNFVYIGDKFDTVSGKFSIFGESIDLIKSRLSKSEFPSWMDIDAWEGIHSAYQDHWESIAISSSGSITEASPKYTTSFLSGWCARKKIVISSANIDESLSSFPLYIKIDGDMELGRRCRPDGHDIRFTKLDGTLLSYEREYFEIRGVRAFGDFWVKTDLDSDKDTEIYIYFGNSVASDGNTPEDVWDDNYTAVWHLGETGDGSTNEFRDSTGNYHGRGGNGNSARVPARVDGKVGYGQLFDGTDDFITFGDVLDNPTNDFTISAWTKTTSTATGNSNGIVYKKSTGQTEAPGVQFFQPEGVYRLRIGDGTNYTEVSTWPHLLNDGEWHQGVAVAERGVEIAMYADGILRNTGPQEWTTDITSSIWLSIGVLFIDPNVYHPFNGTIDEVRFSNIVRSPSWIKFEYNNIQNFSDNIFLSTVEYELKFDRPFYSNYTRRKRITILSENIGDNLEDFPLYVKIENDPDLGRWCRTDGFDIRFTSDDGETLLDFERESFEIVDGLANGHFWVKVDLESDKDNEIYIYYGTGTVDGSSSAWNSDYVAVYHLNEEGSGIAGEYKDSAGNNDAIGGGSIPLREDGKIIYGQEFNADDDYIYSGTLTDVSTIYTASVWIYPYTTTGGNSDHVTHGYSILSEDGTLYPIWLRAHNGEIRISSFDGTTGDSSAVTSGANITNNKWHHILVSATRGDQTVVYVNGESKLSFTNAGTATWVGDFYIGEIRADRKIVFDGIIDEVRVSKSIRSADWAKFEYENIAHYGDNVSIGMHENRDKWRGGVVAPNGKIYCSFQEADTILVINPEDDSVEFIGDDRLLFLSGALAPNNCIYMLPTNSDNVLKINTETNEVSKIELRTSKDAILLLRFNEGRWNKVYDDTENENDGTISGASWSTTSRIGPRSLDFDGIDDYVEVPHDSSLESSEITVTAWVYPRLEIPVGVYGYILVKGDFFANGSYRIYQRNQELGFYAGWDGSHVPARDTNAPFPSINTWYHIAGTFKDGVSKIYINGELKNTVTGLPARVPTTQNIRIGSWAEYRPFDGLVDDVRIFNRALNDEEIHNLSCTPGYDGCILANNNKIYGVPSGANNILVIDPVDDSFETIKNVPDASWKYSGGALAPNGYIYFIPASASHVMKLDISDNTVSNIGQEVTGTWWGGTIAPNGFIYGIPYGATTTQILRIDPSNDVVSVFGDISSATTQWLGGAMAPNGLIYGVPGTPSSILVINPRSDSYWEVGNFVGTGLKFSGAIMSLDGVLYAVPRSYHKLVKIGNPIPQLNSNLPLSRYWNKL